MQPLSGRGRGGSRVRDTCRCESAVNRRCQEAGAKHARGHWVVCQSSGWGSVAQGAVEWRRAPRKTAARTAIAYWQFGWSYICRAWTWYAQNL